MLSPLLSWYPKVFFFLGTQVIASDRKTNVSLHSLKCIELELLLTINILHFTGLQDVSASIFSFSLTSFFNDLQKQTTKFCRLLISLKWLVYEPKGWCNTIKKQHISLNTKFRVPNGKQISSLYVGLVFLTLLTYDTTFKQHLITWSMSRIPRSS